MLLLVFFQWKIFLRKKLSVYKNTDQQEFALEKVCVCKIVLEIKYNIHFSYQLSKICIDISAKNKMTCQGNASHVDDDFYILSHFNSPVLIITSVCMEHNPCRVLFNLVFLLTIYKGPIIA